MLGLQSLPEITFLSDSSLPLSCGGLLARSFLEDLGARSRIFVSHIRRATAGEAGYVNTHPFYRRFDNKTWVFAHNGTIDFDQLIFPTGEFIPIGTTDSELIFCNRLRNTFSLTVWPGPVGCSMSECMSSTHV